MAPWQHKDRGLGRGGKWPTSPSNRKVPRAPGVLELVLTTLLHHDPSPTHARALFRAKAEQAA